MTIKEFFESKDRLVIHCDTEEKAKKLLKAFDKAGYRWRNEEKYTEKSRWDLYKKYTGYSNEGGYGHIICYKEDKYQILEFEEIEKAIIEDRKQELRKELEKHWNELSNEAKETFVEIFGNGAGFNDDEIFLLSKEECEKYKKVIPMFPTHWWLRTPGYASKYVASVRGDGFIVPGGFFVDFERLAVRPALKFNEDVEIGTRIIKHKFPWIVIDKKLAIAEVPITLRSFDKESNDYESSDIRKFLFSWLRERGE